MKTLNSRIRPQAISIVEAMPIDENLLKSAVGNEYGDIYETHLKWAMDSRLNHTKDGDAIPDGYMQYVQPILDAKL